MVAMMYKINNKLRPKTKKNIKSYDLVTQHYVMSEGMLFFVVNSDSDPSIQDL